MRFLESLKDIPYRTYLVIKFIWRKILTPWHACHHAYAIATTDNIEQLKREFVLLLYVRTLVMGLRDQRQFNNVKLYCNFLGYARSGHSIVGALLDAHPDAIISHENDIMGLLRFRIFNKEQIFSLILENSKSFASNKRTWGKYSYQPDNNWQGKFQTLKVIGDKKGGRGTTWLKDNPGLLERLNKTVGVPVKHIHHIRNPFDNISTYCAKRGLDHADKEWIEFYFSRCAIVDDVKEKIDPENIFERRHEYLVSNPKDYLRELCGFLDLECSEDYLESCAKIVFESPNKTRHKITWDKSMIDLVDEHIKGYDFLQGYSFES